jgi:hypothetical protein
MARGNDQVVALIESGYLAQIEPLSQSYHAGVDGLEPQRGVGREQLGHSTVVAGSPSITRSSSSAMAAQNSATRVELPRRIGSERKSYVLLHAGECSSPEVCYLE